MSDDAFRDATDALRKWYWGEVRSLAQEALKEHPIDEEARDEWLHETIDGHEFVTHTAKAQGVLLASDNDGAYVDEMGEEAFAEAVREAGGPPWSLMAYMALLADVREQIAAEAA